MDDGRVHRALTWAWRQLVKIRTRLLVINLVAVLVPVVGIEWARTFEQEGLRALELGMQNQAQILRTLLEENLDEAGKVRFELVSRALEQVALRTRMRVRLLDRTGRLVADSHIKGAPEGPEPGVSRWFGKEQPPERLHPPQEPSTAPADPLSHRVEIRAAAKGQLGTATRVHRRIGRVFLFLALPVMVERRVEGMVYVTRSTTPVLMSLYRLRQGLVQVLAVALGITILMSLFLAATIARPLSRLTTKAERIARGDRTVDLHLQRSDEIGQLGKAFGAMVEQLASRGDYISEFAANISHELKTPLASIRGAAELLADGADQDPSARRRFLHNILQDVGRMDRLVTRILELSRMEATLERREDFDFAQLVQQVTNSFADHHRALELSLESRPLPVRGNRGHLESALRALVENAVRYSPENKPVEVRVSQGGDGMLLVQVRDQGPGISKANQHRVFDRFFTTESARGGTGLGLAIVDLVARSHGGRAMLKSVEGAGCTFEMRIPAAEINGQRTGA